MNAVVADRYRIDGRLGDGGMSSVYRAFDTVLERIVALKVMDERLARDTHAFERVRREAATIAAARSPHVVQVFDLAMHGPTPVVVMELIDGQDLDSILAEHTQHGTRLETRRAVSILRQAAEGLFALHAAGIIHRDVKPANILIEHDTGRTVLIDLGIARRHGKQSGQLICGTPAYISPEQGTGGEATERSDVYSLACTAFDLFAAQPPFAGDDPSALVHLHANAAPPPLSRHRPDLAMFDAVLARALAKLPSARYPSVLAFVEALEDALPPRPSLPEPAAASISHPILSLGRPKSDAERRGPLRVLVVDREPDFSRSAAQLGLHGSALRLKRVTEGRAAVAEAAYKPFDLVILDWGSCNAVDTAARLRELPGSDRARIVIVGKGLDERRRSDFASLGVSDFVERDGSLRDAVATVRELARRSGWLARSDG
jgi:serine/threonine-protein kinase